MTLWLDLQPAPAEWIPAHDVWAAVPDQNLILPVGSVKNALPFQASAS